VQISLHEVMQGLAAHTLDPKTAGLLLYSLQQASTNLLQTPDWKGSCQPVEPSKPLLALDFPSFEQQYQVPKGADLDADFASVEDQLAAAEDSSPCHPELGAPSFAPVVGAKGGSEALSNQDGAPDAAALPSATAESQSQKRSRKKPSHRRGARVPLEKELWEHEDKDAPFRAYTSDGRELTPEDAKLWHKRTMQNLQKHFHKLASSGDAA